MPTLGNNGLNGSLDAKIVATSSQNNGVAFLLRKFVV